MAGIKGRSGGARPGAGRPRKPKDPVVPVLEAGRDMLALLQDIALGKIEVNQTQLRAAIAAVQYTHPKMGEGGKKQQRAADAEKVAGAGGKFAPRLPPRLVVNNGRR